MTMIAGIDDNMDDEDLKEEIMRHFSNAILHSSLAPLY